MDWINVCEWNKRIGKGLTELKDVLLNQSLEAGFPGIAGQAHLRISYLQDMDIMRKEASNKWNEFVILRK